MTRLNLNNAVADLDDFSVIRKIQLRTHCGERIVRQKSVDLAISPHHYPNIPKITKISSEPLEEIARLSARFEAISNGIGLSKLHNDARKID
jgi:hypothetical protein